MNKNELRREYNKIRFEIVEGYGQLVIADHQEGKLRFYKLQEIEKCDTRDKIDNAYLTNGYKHLRQIEDSANKTYDDSV